jgi:hypothetical protein
VLFFQVARSRFEQVAERDQAEKFFGGAIYDRNAGTLLFRHAVNDDS